MGGAWFSAVLSASFLFFPRFNGVWGYCSPGLFFLSMVNPAVRARQALRQGPTVP